MTELFFVYYELSHNYITFAEGSLFKTVIILLFAQVVHVLPRSRIG